MQITLITGANGFFGKKIKMEMITSRIITLGRKKTEIICDLSTQIPKIPSVDLVIHAAGKAHIPPKTPKEQQDFFDVNVTGTQNLLEGLEQAASLPKAFVFISSVSVYGLYKGENISESHYLAAKDPYGLSKIQAEQLVEAWCKTNSVTCTILRLPLLVCSNAPGNLGAMIKAIKRGYYMNIAGGLAKKSMVMAVDVAKCIISVSKVGGIYNLTDGYHPNFKELSDVIANQCDKKKPHNIPTWLANLMAKVGDIIGKKSPFNSYKLSKITASLTFDDSEARKAFGWNPTPVLKAFKL